MGDLVKGQAVLPICHLGDTEQQCLPHWPEPKVPLNSSAQHGGEEGCESTGLWGLCQQKTGKEGRITGSEMK